MDDEPLAVGIVKHQRAETGFCQRAEAAVGLAGDDAGDGGDVSIGDVDRSGPG